MEKQGSLKNIISYAKEHGFIYPSSEIYEGLQSVYDYGPNGINLKKNIKDIWWKSMVMLNNNIVGLDSAIFMHPSVWQASGHIKNFHDLMIDNKDSKKRYRIDLLIENHCDKVLSKKNNKKKEEILFLMNKYIKNEDLDNLYQLIIDEKISCEISKTVNWTKIRKFNLMFETKTGSTEDKSSSVYLRPETAQGIFVNFLNVQKSMRMSIPFGIAQIGKAFRNEIVARQFIFRMREFEQMEMQFFVEPGEEEKWFTYWKNNRYKWYKELGIRESSLNIFKHEQLAHYAKEAVDIEYLFPFGKKEVEGIHSRTDFDLKSHESLSNKHLKYFDQKQNKKYIPYVIETSVGCDRLFLMLLCNSLVEENIISNNKEKVRKFLKIHPSLSPNKAAVLPLMKKDSLSDIAENIYNDIKRSFNTTYDENQSIGKRYARQDLIGTPYCITVDHTTKHDNTVTLRERNTTLQKRINIKAAVDIIKKETSPENFLNKI